VKALLLSTLVLAACEGPGGTSPDHSDPAAQPDAIALFGDTVVSDEGYRIELLGSTVMSCDSVVVRKNGRRIRALALNDGGYQGEHTWLMWTNERFLCFGYGCGSPCWGIQLVDLESGAGPIEFGYTVRADSLRNIVCYPDTTSYDGLHTGFIVENFANGRKRTVLFDHIDSATPAVDFDSSWVENTTLHLRHVFTTRTEKVDLRGVL